MPAAPVPRQLVLALDHAESFAREDFLSGSCNAAALAQIERWPDWSAQALAVVGPEGSGKSHLAGIWAANAGARFLAARALAPTLVPTALATGAVVIENLGPGQFDERALFHLLNLAREERAFVLLTARSAPAGWPIGLADLASRLVGYLAKRIERSLAAARSVVAVLDHEAMRQKRPLTRALAAEILR